MNEDGAFLCLRRKNYRETEDRKLTTESGSLFSALDFPVECRFKQTTVPGPDQAGWCLDTVHDFRYLLT